MGLSMVETGIEYGSKVVFSMQEVGLSLKIK